MRSRVLKLGVSVFGCAVLCGSLAIPELLAQGAAAQTPATTKPRATADLPAAKTILDRHAEAAGGLAAFKARKSTKAIGTMTFPANGMSASMETYSARPNKRYLKMVVAGVGEFLEGFDGTHAWSMDPLNGPRLAEGEEAAQKALDADMDLELDPASKYSSIKTLEKTTFDGRECYKVSLVRKDGVEDIDFYDVATGLKAGSINTRLSPMGKIQGTTTIKEYKTFGGLQIASRFEVSAMGQQIVTEITSVEFDKVDPAVFELPAQIKALIKK
jgi:hypothetical protein